MLKFSAKVDKFGRIYLSSDVRKAAGIELDSIVEIEIRDGEIIIRKSQSPIDRWRGSFKLKRDIGETDIDKLIEVYSGMKF